jgi:Fur family transcriptional regulator, ferric uptake regulator
MRMIVIRTTRYRTDMAGRAQAESDLRALLTRHGIRPTPRRLGVLQALSAERNDATAQEIHTRLRAAGDPIGLATVYRTVALLCEKGVVDALTHSRGEACYRLCSEGHHHHLVCSECHRVVELADCDLGGWLRGLGAAHGFSVTSHTIEVTGVCTSCREAA